MRLKFLWFSIAVFFSVNFSHAQTDDAERALLFSRTSPGGSARIQGMGGAQTALGGDISSAYSNPAGLGMYNHSEIIASIGIQHTTIDSKYFGNSSSSGRANFNLPALGAVFCSHERNNEGFIGGTFSISYNRGNSFIQEMKYKGINPNNSYIDRLLGTAWCKPPAKLRNSNTLAGLALMNYLITDSTKATPPGKRETEYYSVLGTDPRNPKDTRNELQQEDRIQKGNQGQLNAAYGANFNDKIFIGAGIGIALLNYSNTSAYAESNFSFALESGKNPVDFFTVDQTLILNGVGVNATLGIIAKPIHAVQVGLSYATPTAYSINEIAEAGMNVEFNKNGSKTFLNANVAQANSTYSLKTPSRLNAGVTFFLKKAGLVTADVQMVNYAGAQFDAADSGIDFSGANSFLRGSLKRVFNYRMGGEYRLRNYRLRAGYGMAPDSFKDASFDISRTVSSYSLGVGYRTPKVIFDAAAILSVNSFAYSPYPLSRECVDDNGKVGVSTYLVNERLAPYTNSKSQNVSVVISATFPFSRL